MNLIKGVGTQCPANGETLNTDKCKTIPCQALKNIKEGVTTIGSSPSTLSIDTAMEVRTNYIKCQCKSVVVITETRYNRYIKGDDNYD